jgi:hypothetical protein
METTAAVVKVGTVLSGVSPCDGGGRRRCGGRTRLVQGFGVRCPGFVDVMCLTCDAPSVMRPAVAAELASAGAR